MAVLEDSEMYNDNAVSISRSEKKHFGSRTQFRRGIDRKKINCSNAYGGCTKNPPKQNSSAN
jgi:hypothetical protein